MQTRVKGEVAGPKGFNPRKTQNDCISIQSSTLHSNEVRNGKFLCSAPKLAYKNPSRVFVNAPLQTAAGRERGKEKVRFHVRFIIQLFFRLHVLEGFGGLGFSQGPEQLVQMFLRVA